MSRQVVYDQGGNLSTINGLLKDDYVIQQIQDQVNKSTFFLNKLKSEMSTHGRKFIFPIQTGVSQGTGARGENKPIPGAGFGEYDQATGNVKYLYSVLNITGQSIEATAGNKASFADALKQAINDCKEALKLDMQRQVWSDGTGVIGKVDGAHVAGTTTLAVKQPYGLTYAGTVPNDQKTRLFKRKMSLFIDSANPQVVSSVTAVNNDGTLTVPALAQDAASGVSIYRGDSTSTGDNSKTNEIDGLTKIVDNAGTYLGVSRTGLPEWQANLVDAAGALSEAKMRIAMDQSEINGTSSPDLIITDHVNRRRYEALLHAQKRIVNTLKLEGGFSGIEFDGLPMVVDKDAPAERLWFLRTADISWMVMADTKFMDRDGAVLDRVSGYDAYQAILYTYRNLAAKKPVNQTVLYGITS